MKLYELTDQYIQALEFFEENELDEATIADTLGAIEEEFTDKAVNIAKFIKTLEAEAAAVKEEERRLSERKKSFENKAANIKKYLEQQMIATGNKKIKHALFTLGIQKNPPGVDITDEKKVEDKYLVPQPAKIDKKAILADLKQGIKLKYATMKQGESLRIR